jgi:hypothetical protein
MGMSLGVSSQNHQRYGTLEENCGSWKVGLVISIMDSCSKVEPAFQDSSVINHIDAVHHTAAGIAFCNE